MILGKVQNVTFLDFDDAKAFSRRVGETINLVSLSRAQLCLPAPKQADKDCQYCGNGTVTGGRCDWCDSEHDPEESA